MENYKKSSIMLCLMSAVQCFEHARTSPGSQHPDDRFSYCNSVGAHSGSEGDLQIVRLLCRGSHVPPGTLILADRGGFAAGISAILQCKEVLLPWRHLCDGVLEAVTAMPLGIVFQEWP